MTTPEPTEFIKLVHLLFDGDIRRGRELMRRARFLEAGQPDLFDGAGHNGDGADAPMEAQGPKDLNG